MFPSLILLCGILAVTFVLTMVGLGGGLVFSPLFVILGYAKADAASASLFLNLIAAASAAIMYSRKKMVDFSLAMPLICSSALLAPVGSFLNAGVDTRPFMLVLAVVLILAGGRMLMPPPGQGDAVQVGGGKKMAGGLVIGACIGLMGGFLGIGGGVFIVPLLIYILKVPTKIAAASSTFIVCFSSLTGFLGYAAAGPINWGFILPAAVVSYVGGFAGAKVMSTKVKGKSIRMIFSVVLFALAAKIVHQAFF
ncbi:MAG: sulfite exporter TauE/SafE family protein [Desulfobacterales bacterium]|nr:sulfite exporter TauE/SafE family protein [Desulfobacterales bacterium]